MDDRAADPDSAWCRLRGWAVGQPARLSAPPPGAPGLCAVCHGAAPPGCARCFQCALHAELAPGGLADLVVPIAYAPKGGAHARNLWLYKSGLPGADRAAAALRVLLLAFLHDHGRCAWQRAEISRPTLVAAVPSGRGRAGAHPLHRLIAPYLSLAWAELSPRPGGDRIRELDPGRFTAARQPGADVLLLDDTWTSGASAQSAAMALRLAGAHRVVVVVLGRHLSATRGLDGGFASPMPYRPELCAVHDPPPGPRARGAASFAPARGQAGNT
jgi:hypothetical protein